MESNFKSKWIIVGCLIVLSVLNFASAERVQSADQIIYQAQKYDRAYSSSPDASQQKAIALYETALVLAQDDKTTKEILLRLAELNGSSFRTDLGENPNYHYAINFYEELIQLCESNDPLVYKSMCSISDHYISLGDYQNALEWAKKALDFDTVTISKEIQDIAIRTDFYELDPTEGDTPKLTASEKVQIRNKIRKMRKLERDLKEIKNYQDIAVDKISYSASLINPLIAHGELKSIIRKYSGTIIADKAHAYLIKHMDNMSELWDTTLENNLPVSTNFKAEDKKLNPQKDLAKKKIVVPENKKQIIQPNYFKPIFVSIICCLGITVISIKSKTFLRRTK